MIRPLPAVPLPSAGGEVCWRVALGTGAAVPVARQLRGRQQCEPCVRGPVGSHSPGGFVWVEEKGSLSVTTW